MSLLLNNQEDAQGLKSKQQHIYRRKLVDLRQFQQMNHIYDVGTIRKPTCIFQTVQSECHQNEREQQSVDPLPTPESKPEDKYVEKYIFYESDLTNRKIENERDIKL